MTRSPLAHDEIDRLVLGDVPDARFAGELDAARRRRRTARPGRQGPAEFAGAVVPYEEPDLDRQRLLVLARAGARPEAGAGHAMAAGDAHAVGGQQVHLFGLVGGDRHRRRQRVAVLAEYRLGGGGGVGLHGRHLGPHAFRHRHRRTFAADAAGHERHGRLLEAGTGVVAQRDPAREPCGRALVGAVEDERVVGVPAEALARVRRLERARAGASALERPGKGWLEEQLLAEGRELHPPRMAEQEAVACAVDRRRAERHQFEGVTCVRRLSSVSTSSTVRPTQRASRRSSPGASQRKLCSRTPTAPPLAARRLTVRGSSRSGMAVKRTVAIPAGSVAVRVSRTSVKSSCE
jgi:hypothetical protein